MSIYAGRFDSSVYAAKVLQGAKEPMNCQELIKAMADKGYRSSPNGLTYGDAILSDPARNEGEGR
jgi:hypothetical protein